MGSRWFRASLVLIGAVAVGVYIAVRQSEGTSDTATPVPQPIDPFGSSDTGRALRHFLSVMYAHGENAEENYRKALESLRANPEATVALLAQAESSIRETDYPSRWALIFTASELRHSAALPYLSAVALSRIPAERSSDPHSFSTVAEETILRTTAVEGLGHLASDNNTQAVDALFACLSRPSLSVRRAAVQALLSTPNGQQHRERIAQALPDDQRFLLDLRRIDVREAPQVRSPQQFLAPGVVSGGQSPAPPPDRPDNKLGRFPYTGKNPPPTLSHR